MNSRNIIIGVVITILLLIFRTSIMSFLDTKSNQKIEKNTQKNIEIDKKNAVLNEKKEVLIKEISTIKEIKHLNIIKVKSFNKKETEEYWKDELRN